MQITSNLAFISDLHLDELHPEIVQEFLQLLRYSQEHINTLYILGDFFESWIGDDHSTPFIKKIMDALSNATANGLTIYFMHGNRDFLIGQRFFQQTGCIPLPDPHVIQINNQAILLMHGDTLCTLDKKYVRARKWFRNGFVQSLFLSLPLWLREKIAMNMRVKSKEYTKVLPLEIMDVSQKEVEHVMQIHNVNVLIHGHTHRPALHVFTINGVEKQRIVLDAWHEFGSTLIWNHHERKTMKVKDLTLSS